MIIKNPKINLNPTDKAYSHIADKDSVVSQFMKQSEWSFRIYAQMLHRVNNGYNIYFFTLTFKDKFLPKFRFLDKECPCFDREIVRKFVRGVQMDLLKKYNVTDYDYILCCEFGKSATFRPHLHGCFMVPNNVSAEQVHDLIKKHWSVLTGRYAKNGMPFRESLGWVLPAKYFGGMDAKGHYHKPLMVDPKNIDSAAVYVSKYCTKQVDYYKNAQVIAMQKLIAKEGGFQDKRNFRRCCPFIKVSQHFGECIKDWIFGENIPNNNLIKVDENPFMNLASGIWTPLSRKSKTRIPYYIVRKLMFDKVEEIVEKIDEYTDQDWYSYSVFDDEIYKGLRPLIRRHKLKYTYITQYSDFWVDYSSFEFDYRVEQMINDIDLYRSFIDGRQFQDFLSGKGVDVNHFRKKLNEIDSKSLAVYSVAYRGRFSPMHYYALKENPQLFTNSLRGILTERHNKPVSDEYWKACGFEGFQVDTYYDEQLEFTYYNYVRTYVDLDFELYEELKERNILGPYYSGRESVSDMVSSAKGFYLSRLNYVQTREDTTVDEHFNCLFNSFPCFEGFDLILNCIADYKEFCSTKKINKIRADYDKKKHDKDNFFNS